MERMLMSDKCNTIDMRMRGWNSFSDYLEEIEKRTLRSVGVPQCILEKQTAETATEIAAQERRKAIWSGVRFLGEPTLFSGSRSDFREPSTESILRYIGGINMGKEFVEHDNIEKVIIRTKDGREFDGYVKRIEYMPGPFGAAGYSDITVSTLKQTSKENYGIKEVIFNNPATIVKWDDGTQTVVYCQDDYTEVVKTVNGKKVKVRKPKKSDGFNPEIGLAMAIVKKHFGNRGNYNNVFHKYIPESRDDQKPTENTEEKAEE